jgi:cell division protease FtsH
MQKKETKKKSTKKNQVFSPKNSGWRNLIWYSLIVLTLVSILTTYFGGPKGPSIVNFTDFLNLSKTGQIKSVTLKTSDQQLLATTTANKKIKTNYINYSDFIKELIEKKISIEVNPTDSGWFLSLFLQAFLPFILIALLWFFIFRQAQGANGQAMSFGKAKFLSWNKKNNKESITFKDVAGVNEAVEELKEIVEFLKHPKRYLDIGAKLPKGVLLMGSPGTGKTLLAKAIAGEADVPFFSLSGSDFVEMFVGVGASRVRDLFAQAKKSQPGIIFVDEIDAVGRHRGAGLGGGHDEREQTLNQLLVEMDGFDPKETVIVIAATNRPDILDPALLRPGRFDRQIVVDKPDIKGRQDILKIHSKNKKIHHDIDLEIVAKRTPGFTGADLANLVNEAALLAARKGKKIIEMVDFEEGTDRVIAGPERKSRIISTKEKEIVAYHEVGHALVAKKLKNVDPVHKISILPRGLALGYTLQLPLEDKYLILKDEIEDQIKVLLGGRIAEELIFNTMTSGASNDIEKATELSRNYVCKFGMNPKLGARKYGKTQEHVFLGKDYSDHSKDYSEDTAREIDEAISKLIDQSYLEAKKILTQFKDKLIIIAKELIEKEVIEGEALDILLDNHKETVAAK